MTPFDEGVAAHKAGRPLEPNPYGCCVSQAREWNAGWRAQNWAHVHGPVVTQDVMEQIVRATEARDEATPRWEAMVTASIADTRRAIESNAETVEALDIVRLTLMEMAASTGAEI